MKAVILAGGQGVRLTEETQWRPKPMVEIGGKPILWHIMKIYSHHGINDFIVCLGHKGYFIKEYFSNYLLHQSDVTFDFRMHKTVTHQTNSEPWSVTLVDTGEHTMTGGRLKRVAKYIGDETFCLTYGDGVADIDISALIDFHRSHDGAATLTSVIPPGRFGAVSMDNDGEVLAFQEKPGGDGSWINGGFFVMEPSVINKITGDDTSLEVGPLQSLVNDQSLYAYRHKGFWRPMDTLRDKLRLEELWRSGNAAWKVWD